MAVSEQARRRLYEQVEAQMGEEAAVTLMDSLPPAGWGDVATKQDLDHLHQLMQLEMATLASDLRSEMTELRSELRTEFRTEIAGLRAELHHELRIQLVTMFSANLGLAGVILAALKLF